MNEPPPARPMRILILRVGGWENWVDTVASFLARNGIEVTGLVFLPESKGPLNAAPGVELVTKIVPRGLLGKMGATWRAGGLLRRHLAQNHYDLLYVVDSWSIPTLWAATTGTLRPRGMSVAYQTFEWLDPSVHHCLHVHLERRMCRAADLVINVDRLKGRLQQMLYRLKECPLWIRVGLARDYPIPPASAARRTELLGSNPPADALTVIAPTIAHADRLTLEIIRALAILPERYRFATIAGADDYFTQCKEETEQLGLSNRVVFLPRQPFAQLMEYIASADLGVVLHDGRTSSGNFMANPMRVTQCAASGLPFIASDFPTLAGEVYRYGLGVCCDELSPASIADGLRALGEDGQLLAKRRVHVRRMFQEHLCFESRGSHMLEALQRLCRA